MKFMVAMAIALALVLAAFPAEAETNRSTAQINKFKRAYPCPAQNLPADHKVTGACPGYVIDHKIPLCAGGPDTAENMAWSLKGPSIIKDKEEIGLCAGIRAKRLPAYNPQPLLCLVLAPSQFPIIRGFMCSVVPP